MSIDVLTMVKKNATRRSRAKSTPKEEGGGDKSETCRLPNEQHNQLMQIIAHADTKIKIDCCVAASRSQDQEHLQINNNNLLLFK